MLEECEDGAVMLHRVLSRGETVAVHQPMNDHQKRLGSGTRFFLFLATVLVIAVLVWTGITAAGAPTPAEGQKSKFALILDIGVLVFREGLECILVLSAITASMVGTNARHRRPVAAGAGIGALATLITWFIATRIVESLADNLNALQVQAWTGLLAVVVLLIVMNWFFHTLYWGGWISAHNRKRKQLLADAQQPEISASKLYFGLGLLGFSSFYREGFEVVLFLQSFNLKMGGAVVGFGALLGVFLSGIVAVLTFIAHHKLPYRKMLELTGILLGVVLLVMVGEQAQEMQQAGWIPTTKIPWLDPYMPDWLGLWFSVFPTVETLSAQGMAAAAVIGSFLVAKKAGTRKSPDASPIAAS
jgi:high-affinity iron transporter